ncbi:MAG TPA: hypothetical protein VLV87_07800 [Gammaproteobacteria bacterium]|nr:hypothetical protein [Gammaproteobacteria bacterium]
MNGQDLDPNFFLPLWQTLVRYFRAYPPLAQAPQQLESPAPLTEAQRRPYRAARRSLYLPKDLEGRLPCQPSP